MYSCLLKGVISDYLLLRNSSKKWPTYSGYSLVYAGSWSKMYYHLIQTSYPLGKVCQFLLWPLNQCAFCMKPKPAQLSRLSQQGSDFYGHENNMSGRSTKITRVSLLFCDLCLLCQLCLHISSFTIFYPVNLGLDVKNELFVDLGIWENYDFWNSFLFRSI